MKNARIEIDGERYLLDLPDESCVEKMNGQLSGKFERLFFAKSCFTSPSGIEIVDYKSVYLTGGTSYTQTSVGFASEFSKFTGRAECELLPGKSTLYTVFLPVLIPLGKNGQIQPINDQDWSTVKGGTLYQDDKPMSPPDTDFPMDASPVGNRPMTIGDTVEGQELAWYVVNGMLLAKYPICRCSPKALAVAGIGTSKERRADHA